MALVFGIWPTSTDPPVLVSQQRPRLATSPRGETKLTPPEARVAPQATVWVPVPLESDPEAVAAPLRSLNVVEVLAVQTSPAQVVRAAFDAASVDLLEYTNSVFGR